MSEQNGQIFQINVSNGGVPKTPVREAIVNKLGITTDKQKHTKFHGGPTRALCLYSLDLILALQAEGHPIFAGAVGENITLSGINWHNVVPGAQLSLGNQVLIEITEFAVPCQQIKHSFHTEKFTRISEKLHPGWARAYAKILSGGVIQLGDHAAVVKMGESHG